MKKSSKTSNNSNVVYYVKDIIEDHTYENVKCYKKGKLLGQGGFARCYEFSSLDSGHVYAAKVVPKSTLSKSSARKKLLTEIRIHRSLNHKNIVRFERFFEDKYNVYILLEKCPHQTMMELVKQRERLTEPEARYFSKQLIEAMHFMHSNSVIHRDLKLGNLFLGNDLDIKVGDFGLAAMLEHDGERKRTICGTPNYIAPEILDGPNGHSFEVDIWSFGVILYTMLIGKPPFETQNLKGTFRRIRASSYNFPSYIPISSAAQSLIVEILNVSPDQRPSLEYIENHPFFKEYTPEVLPLSALQVAPETSMKNFAPEGIKTAKNNPEKYNIFDKENDPNQKNKPILPISHVTEKQNIISSESDSDADLSSVVWVSKWIDYHKRYGLGYLLANGCTGVHFNDNSKIVAHPELKLFNYYDSNEKESPMISLSYDEYPSTIRKKVTLHKHFKSFLLDHQAKEIGDNFVWCCKANPKNLIYVDSWIRTKHGILFRLSNGMTQINFNDRTEVMFFDNSSILIFTDKTGHRRSYTARKAQEMPDLQRRVKYCKEVIRTMEQISS